jgi:hypothetical protein
VASSHAMDFDRWNLDDENFSATTFGIVLFAAQLLSIGLYP